MNEKNALVPVAMNIGKLESLPINGSRKLTADDKKRLLEVLTKKLRENNELLNAKVNEAKQEILDQAREKAGLDAYVKEMENLEIQLDAIRDKISVVKLRCENNTGFTTEGDLLPTHRNNGWGTDREEKDRLWKAQRDRGLTKAQAVRDKMNLVATALERFATKFDKVQTRLLLADTYADAMIIMDAVLGNGDEILNADIVKEDIDA